jgi:hypothetical protein
MEEFLKLASSPQSQRSALLVFAYQLLLVFLMTKWTMTKFGYHFVNQDIKLNTVIQFVLSPAFVVVLMAYLMWVFVIFWSMKVIGLLAVPFLTNGSFSLPQLAMMFQFYRLIKRNDDRYEFVSERAKEIVQSLVKEAEDGFQSEVLKIIARSSNLLISTTLVYWSCGGTATISFWLGVFLLILSGLAALCCLGSLAFIIKIRQHLPSFLLAVVKRRFCYEYH